MLNFSVTSTTNWQIGLFTVHTLQIQLLRKHSGSAGVALASAAAAAAADTSATVADAVAGKLRRQACMSRSEALECTRLNRCNAGICVRSLFSKEF